MLHGFIRLIDCLEHFLLHYVVQIRVVLFVVNNLLSEQITHLGHSVHVRAEGQRLRVIEWLLEWPSLLQLRELLILALVEHLWDHESFCVTLLLDHVLEDPVHLGLLVSQH